MPATCLVCAPWKNLIAGLNMSRLGSAAATSASTSALTRSTTDCGSSPSTITPPSCSIAAQIVSASVVTSRRCSSAMHQNLRRGLERRQIGQDVAVMDCAAAPVDHLVWFYEERAHLIEKVADFAAE